MIVSRGRGYVFVHIPKTGGTSLALALEARARKDDILIGDTPKARRRNHRAQEMTARGRVWKHSTLADIDGLVPIGEMQRLFAFTLVRNPWDRVVSLYHWAREQGFDHPLVALAGKCSFPQFAVHPVVCESLRAAPASSYMRRADGFEQCALYIRLEHFGADAEPLFEHLGFRIDLPRANASKRARDYRRYYSDAGAQAVADACTEDIARFGYSFD